MTVTGATAEQVTVAGVTPTPPEGVMVMFDDTVLPGRPAGRVIVEPEAGDDARFGSVCAPAGAETGMANGTLLPLVLVAVQLTVPFCTAAPSVALTVMAGRLAPFWNGPPEVGATVKPAVAVQENDAVLAGLLPPPLAIEAGTGAETVAPYAPPGKAIAAVLKVMVGGPSRTTAIVPLWVQVGSVLEEPVHSVKTGVIARGPTVALAAAAIRNEQYAVGVDGSGVPAPLGGTMRNAIPGIVVLHTDPGTRTVGWSIVRLVVSILKSN